jgi:hypothetical protein
MSDKRRSYITGWSRHPDGTIAFMHTNEIARFYTPTASSRQRFERVIENMVRSEWQEILKERRP